MKKIINSRFKFILTLLFAVLLSFTACNKDKPIICELDVHEPNNSIDSFKNLGNLEDGNFITITGNISDINDVDFYKIILEESFRLGLPGTAEYFHAIFELTPPPGLDYDLYIYDDEGVEINKSANKGDEKEVANYYWTGSYGFDDSKDFKIEVRPYEGAWSCDDYTLKIELIFSSTPW